MMRNTISRRLIVSILAFISLICMTLGLTMAHIVGNAQVVTPQGKVELYQLSPDPLNLLECYVIKTAGGKLIVIDGGRDSMNQGAPETDGNAFNSGSGAAPYLTNALRKIAGKGENENVEIEAWFLSHAHGDHYFELAKMLYGYTDAETVTLSDEISPNFGEITYATDTNFTIKNFYFDFPNAPDADSKQASNANWNDISKSLLNVLKTGFTNYAIKNGIEVAEGSTYYDDLNGAVVNETAIRGGLNFDIDGVRIEVLQTWAKTDGNTNDNSMILKVWVDGQSVLFLNDAGEAAGDRLIDTYGAKYLESDIIQLAHHGQNGVRKEFYDAINASEKIRLWCIPIDVWNDEGNSEFYATAKTRGWLGLPEDPVEATATINKSVDIVGSLYDAYPEKLGAEDAYAIPYASWTDEVLEGMKISLPYDKAYKGNFVMETGASIRLVEGSNGIRFSAVLTEYDDTSEYGFIILPTQLLTKNSINSNFHEALTENSIPFLDVKSTVYQEGLHFRINGSVSNIMYENINVKYTGIAYEKTEEGVYVYAKYDSLDDISRSVLKVALSALNELEYNEDIDESVYELLSSNKSVLDGYVQKSVNKKNDESENASVEHTFAWDETNNLSALYIGETRTLKVDTEYDSSCILWKSSDEDIATVENGVVVAKGYGSVTITAYCAGKSVETTLTVAAKEGYLADFDGEVYKNFITEYTHYSAFSAATIEKTYLPEYMGDEGVLKVTTTNNDSNQQGGFIIKLPKAMVMRDDGYYSFTIRYMIKSEADIFAFGRKGSSYSSQNTIKYFSNATMATQEGKWQVLFVETLADGYGEADEILINIWGGGVGAKTEIYLSAIKPNFAVDSLKKFTDSLEEGYLADFSSAEYENFVTAYPVFNSDSQTQVTATVIDEFEGETGVIKLDGVVNVSCETGFVIKLPRRADGKPVKIRIYNAYTGSQALFFGNPDVTQTAEELNASTNYADRIRGAWNTVELDYSTYENDDTIEIYTYSGSGEQTITLYVAWVMTAKTADQIAEELSAGLVGNDLANFDSADYTNMIVPFHYSNDLSAGTLRAEYLDSHEEETGVVKVNTTGSRGNFIIKLPKAMTAINGYYTFTIKMMVNATSPSSSVVGFATPGDNTYDGAYWTGNSLANISNVWTTYVLSVPTSSYYGNADEILFTIYGGNVEMYIARVGLGDQTNAWANESVIKELATNMPDGYLGEFNSAEYASLVTKSTFAYRGAASFTTELVSVEGIGNVIKVTTTGSIADIMIQLPKKATSGMTLKFMVEKTSANFIVFRNPIAGASGDGLYTFGISADAVSAKVGTWHTIYMNYTSVADDYKDDIYVEWSGANAESVIYIAWVKDGDVTSLTEP